MQLASEGARVIAVGRRSGELQKTARRSRGPGHIEPCVADLTVDAQVKDLGAALLAEEDGVHALIHSAGTISRGRLETARIHDLDRQYVANVRAPYLLTQTLLPALSASEGQIVFINSSAGLTARASWGQFAGTQYALRAIADSLREEVNERGIRVISVYPGRTATPRQAEIHSLESKHYAPERLIQPSDVASVVVESLNLPRSAELTEVKIRPMLKH